MGWEVRESPDVLVDSSEPSVGWETEEPPDVLLDMSKS